EVCHEGPVLPEVGEEPSPRLQSRSPSRQGLRDLQVEPAFQGAPALNHGRVLRFARKPPPGGFLLCGTPLSASPACRCRHLTVLSPDCLQSLSYKPPRDPRT